MSTLKTNKLAHTANGASEFTLPQTDGSANQVIKTDGSGNLAFTTPAASAFSSYAIICDQKSAGTAGGSSTTGAFYNRDLNTELADPDNIVSISNNKFTLQAGSYLIKASCPAHLANAHSCLIHNETDGQLVEVGTSEYVVETGSTTRCFVMARTTIASAKEFSIRHRVGRAEAGNGLGVPNNFDLTVEKYTMVEIYKEA